MPDWSYSTVFQPLFRSLPHETGRRFVNGFLGTLSSLPGGGKAIELMGHSAPPRDLLTSFLGLSLASPVVLAPAIDPSGRASRAFHRFGFGALVIGPVGPHSVTSSPTFAQTSAGTLVGDGGPVLGPRDLDHLSSRAQRGPLFAELFLELEGAELAAQCELLFSGLQGRVDLAILSPQCFREQSPPSALRVVRDAARAHALPLLLGLPESLSAELTRVWAGVAAGLEMGVYLSGHPSPNGGWEWGGAHERTVAAVRELRSAHPELALAADSGALAPLEAVELVEAGADLVVVSAGLVQTGPGLPKRINEALLDSRWVGSEEDSSGSERPLSPQAPAERMAWFWAMVLGLCLLIGAGLAGWVALTDVVLPYDEEFCGKTGAEIAAFNPKILSFMVHDRITLSGTMVSLGILYAALAWFEIRRGAHWAQRAVQISAVSGFVSFFAFLGYGYFDPFHAMVAAILSQITIQIFVLPAGPLALRPGAVSLTNDRAWRRGMWGQLLFVIHGAALILAGTVILTYGISVVFVPQDIAFIGMDAQSLELFDAQLKALIAHDRATFGGMLVSAGLALLLTSLWGYRRGQSWLWWVYLVVISEPYLQTLWIHHSIGYRDHFHLAPVYIGLILLVAGLACSRDYLSDAPRNR